MRVIFFYHSDSLCFDDDLDFRKDKFGNLFRSKSLNLFFLTLMCDCELVTDPDSKLRSDGGIKCEEDEPGPLFVP